MLNCQSAHFLGIVICHQGVTLEFANEMKEFIVIDCMMGI